MTAADLKKLREPFKPEQIGKLPKPTKKDNPKGKCDFCGGWHGLPAIHLDYVGHAAVTDRLLSVDPDYQFGPVLDVNQRPITHESEMLYSLTILGSTRYEWGEGPNMKEISSDAIRRCAMRFGVALDLWAKEPLEGSEAAPEDAAPRSTSPSRRAGSRTPKLRASQINLLQAAKDAKVDDDLRHRISVMLTGTASVKDMTDDEADKVTRNLAWFSMHRAPALVELEEWERKNGIA